MLIIRQSERGSKVCTCVPASAYSNLFVLPSMTSRGVCATYRITFGSSGSKKVLPVQGGEFKTRSATVPAQLMMSPLAALLSDSFEALCFKR